MKGIQDITPVAVLLVAIISWNCDSAAAPPHRRTAAPNVTLIANTPISFWPNLTVDQQALPSVVGAVTNDLSGLPILYLGDLRLPLVAVKF